jgi:hypothetical protein
MTVITLALFDLCVAGRDCQVLAHKSAPFGLLPRWSPTFGKSDQILKSLYPPNFLSLPSQNRFGCENHSLAEPFVRPSSKLFAASNTALCNSSSVKGSTIKS